MDHQIIREHVRKNSAKAQAIQKYYYDRNHKAQDFKPMDLVLMRSRPAMSSDDKKLAFLWVGPYLITKMITHENNTEPQAALIIDPTKMVKILKPVAFADLKPYKHLTSEDEEMENNEISESNPPNKLIGEIITQLSIQIVPTSINNYTNVSRITSNPMLNPTTRTYSRIPAQNNSNITVAAPTALPIIPILNRMQLLRWPATSKQTSRTNINEQISTPSANKTNVADEYAESACCPPLQGQNNEIQNYDERTETSSSAQVPQIRNTTSPIQNARSINEIAQCDSPIQINNSAFEARLTSTPITPKNVTGENTKETTNQDQQ